MVKIYLPDTFLTCTMSINVTPASIKTSFTCQIETHSISKTICKEKTINIMLQHGEIISKTRTTKFNVEK